MSIDSGMCIFDVIKIDHVIPVYKSLKKLRKLEIHLHALLFAILNFSKEQILIKKEETVKGQ
ncbi:MAG: hypothetical protein ACXADL_09345 [Candidatus Thorarchaeota archaeon]|jgi:hypothetical protein